MAKFNYDVNIPGSGSFEVNSDTELTDQQAYDYALQSCRLELLGRKYSVV